MRLFHISEEADIKIFVPRPSPSVFDAITGDVVFAISERLLHNYLLPRDCPRVTYYSGPAGDDSSFVVAIEAGWVERVRRTTLYCYEFPVRSFSLLDECAGYYISYEPIVPLSVRRIDDPFAEMAERGNIELRVLPDLWDLADTVRQSGLNYSLIRMRNAKDRPSFNNP